MSGMNEAGVYGLTENAMVTQINRNNGAIGWTTAVGVDANPTVAFNIAVDSSDNIYLSGLTQQTPVTVFIAKLDSSGAVVWQRNFGNAVDPTREYYFYGHKEIAVYNQTYAITGYTYIAPAGGSLAAADMFVAQFPTDGSFTGTYTGFQYVPANYIVKPVLVNWADQGFTQSGTGFAVDTATLTVTNNDQTNVVVVNTPVTSDWTFDTTGALTLPQGIELPGKVTNPGASSANSTTNGAPIIDISSGIAYLTPIISGGASYILPPGLYDGQIVIVLPAITAGASSTDVNNVWVFSQEGFYNITSVDTAVPWYPFINYGNTNSIGTPQAVWSATYNCWYPQPWNFD